MSKQPEQAIPRNTHPTIIHFEVSLNGVVVSVCRCSENTNTHTSTLSPQHTKHSKVRPRRRNAERTPLPRTGGPENFWHCTLAQVSRKRDLQRGNARLSTACSKVARRGALLIEFQQVRIKSGNSREGKNANCMVSALTSAALDAVQVESFSNIWRGRWWNVHFVLYNVTIDLMGFDGRFYVFVNGIFRFEIDDVLFICCCVIYVTLLCCIINMLINYIVFVYKCQYIIFVFSFI